MRNVISCLFSSVLFFQPVASFAAPPQVVGKYGDLDRVLIRGSEAYSADQIRRGLKSDLALLPVTRSDASFSEFGKTLRLELTDAYRRDGYLNIDVRVEWSDADESTVITISEGPCFHWDRVIVEGVNDDLRKSILRWITQPHPPIDSIYGSTTSSAETSDWTTVTGQLAKLQDPVWKTGKPANYYELYLELVRKLVDRALQDHGYQTARSQIDIVSDQNTQTASLKIQVIDLGPAAVVDRITILGNKRNTREQILKLAEIETGDSCTAETLLKAQQRLWHSGRYRWSTVRLATQLIPTDPVEVLIELAEYDKAPPLSEGLGDLHRVACRSAEWLTRLPEDEYDLIVSLSSRNCDADDPPQPAFQTVVVVSPKSGFLVRMTGPDYLRGGEESVLVTMNQNAIDLVLDRSRQRFHLPVSESASIVWSVEMKGLREINQKDNSQLQLSFGAGINSSKISKPQKIIVAPMSMMYLFDKSDQPKFEDDRLTLNGPTMFGKVDVASGRPIELKDESKSDAEIQTLAFKTERGGFDRLRREWLDSTPITSDGSQQPMTAFGKFIMRSLEDTQLDDPHAARRFAVCSKLVARVAGRLDSLVRKHTNNSDSPAMHVGSNYKGENSALASLFTFAIPIQDFLFARDTKPWKFGREIAAYVLLDDPQAQTELNKLMESRESGPLTHLYMAACLSALAPPIAGSLAKQGLERLDEIHLRNDLREWLNEDGIIGELLVECASALRELSAEDLDTLLHGLPQAEIVGLKTALADDRISDHEFALRATELLWNHGGGQELVKKTLQRIVVLSLPATAMK